MKLINQYFLYGMLITMGMTASSAFASCSDNVEIPEAYVPAEMPDWDDNISGEPYDWTVTNEPERPYMHRYDKTMMTKIYLAQPDGKGGTMVNMTFAEALDVIKGLDAISRGVPKIAYLVGWQYEGHDCKYPAFFEFNEALKRPEDATAQDSYRWLREEAKKYNTTVSVHVLIFDAYTNSPLWHDYVKNDFLCLDATGAFMQRAVYNGLPMYDVNIVNEWKKGALQDRLEKLIALTDLKDAGTLHFDAFFPRESPGHGTTIEQMEVVMRKIIRWLRDREIDLTVEFYHNTQRTDPMYGLNAAAWWIDMSSKERAAVPPTVAAGGAEGLFGAYWNEETFLFGDNYMLEEDFNWLFAHPDRNMRTAWNSVKLGVATRTIPYMYYNTHRCQAYDEVAKTATYNDGLVTDYKNMTVKKNGVLLRDHDNTFFPLVWKTDHREIVAYSKNGYSNKRWTLPEGWEDVTEVKAFTVTENGLSDERTLPVTDGSVQLAMDANMMVSLQAPN